MSLPLNFCWSPFLSVPENSTTPVLSLRRTSIQQSPLVASIFTRSFCHAGTAVELARRLGRRARRRRRAADAQGAGMGLGLVAATPVAQAECVDHAEGDETHDGDDDDGVAPPVAARLADDRRTAEGLVVFRGRRHASRAELPDDDLGVESEIVGVRAQEALDVRDAGHDVPVLVLHGLDVLDADLDVFFDLLQREVAADPGFAQRVADLKHGGCGTPHLVAGPPLGGGHPNVQSSNRVR